MARPGLVLEVDERTPPLLVHEGEVFRLQKFPLGTQVLYPPDSLPPINDVTSSIRQALLTEREIAASQGVYNFTEKDRYGVDERSRILLTVKDGKYKLVQ